MFIRFTIEAINSGEEETINAIDWFEQASDDEISNLAQSGLESSVCTDAILYFFESKNPHLEYFLKKAQNNSGESLMGFDCYINKEDLLKWIKIRRNNLCSLFEQI